jgi:hypothetical protein
MSWTDDYFKNEVVYLEASTQLSREILEEQGCSRREVEFKRVILPDKTARCFFLNIYFSNWYCICSVKTILHNTQNRGTIKSKEKTTFYGPSFIFWVP